MNRKQRNKMKIEAQAEGMYYRIKHRYQIETSQKERQQACPVFLARQRGINRKLSRYHFGLNSKKHAIRFVEATL